MKHLKKWLFTFLLNTKSYIVHQCTHTKNIRRARNERVKTGFSLSERLAASTLHRFDCDINKCNTHRAELFTLYRVHGRIGARGHIRVKCKVFLFILFIHMMIWMCRIVVVIAFCTVSEIFSCVWRNVTNFGWTTSSSTERNRTLVTEKTFARSTLFPSCLFIHLKAAERFTVFISFPSQCQFKFRFWLLDKFLAIHRCVHWLNFSLVSQWVKLINFLNRADEINDGENMNKFVDALDFHRKSMEKSFVHLAIKGLRFVLLFTTFPINEIEFRSQ